MEENYLTTESSWIKQQIKSGTPSNSDNA